MLFHSTVDIFSMYVEGFDSMCSGFDVFVVMIAFFSFGMNVGN
jgi:hypothetical protein